MRMAEVTARPQICNPSTSCGLCDTINILLYPLVLSPRHGLYSYTVFSLIVNNLILISTTIYHGSRYFVKTFFGKRYILSIM